MPYIGTSPSNGVRRLHTYTATANQTTFTGASSEGVTLSYADTNYIDVFQNGVLLGSDDYTATSGTSVVLSQSASSSDLIVIICYDVFSVADTVSKSNGGSFDSAVTMSNNLTVSGAFTSQGIDDNADANAITITSAEEIGIGTSSPTSSSGGKLLAIETSADEHTNVVFNTANVGKSGILEGRRTGRSGSERFAQINLQNNADKGELRFYTAPSGSDVSERMRIEGDGSTHFGKTDSTISDIGTSISTTLGVRPTVSGDVCMLANRLSSDGTLIQFRQDSTAEGSISVSGTTVSYNGGHLSRWSQLTDNTRDDTIVKGTVMTNLDQMAEWTTDGVTEDNEQLNCMAVSSVEGDVNVSGVFVNWDNDDDVYTNDMNVAMTGDMVIRIAKDTTVARGDLLMSVGDGTAKPQDDDIVRSKTIAKVTSTNVSHTYDDGTYLVPCVLMAC